MTRDRAVLACILSLLLLGAAVYGVLPNDGPGGHVVRAEFQNVDLLVPGNDVLIRGTKVGSVHDTQLTKRGTVMVTMSLFDAVPAPRTDATASVRAADLLGDVYLALDPGNASRDLRGAVPPSRTFVATHVQDVFDTFDEPTRAALQSLIVELGRALDGRGLDVNRAVLNLAPALGELDRVAGQLGAQGTQLTRLITSARKLTGTLAPRTGDIERLITDLERTLDTTSAHRGDLDRGLQALPSTLRRTRSTLAKLEQTAKTATPLARDLGAVAAPLTSTLHHLPQFTADAKPALAQLQPILRLAGSTLDAGRTSLPRLDAALTRVRSAAPALRGLSTVITPVLDKGVKGILGGLGGLAAEPGEQAASTVPGRNYFRGELVLGCEMFGVPTHPGCLADAAKALVDTGRTDAPTAGAQTATAPADAASPADRPKPSASAPAAGGPPRPAVTPTIPGVVGAIPNAVGGAVHGLLDFLLGP